MPVSFAEALTRSQNVRRRVLLGNGFSISCQPDIFVTTIAGQHPAHPSETEGGRYRARREFLSNFHLVYTLNYDLLLYWAIMRSELGCAVPVDDGFRTPDTGEAEYVTWEVESTTPGARVLG